MRPLLLALLAACATEQPQSRPAIDDGAKMRVAEGSAEAYGILRFLNDAGTTQAVLDYDVGLDRRAATALSEHRDGPDGRAGTRDDYDYDTIAEVDAQYYVGDAAFDALLAYTAAEGWVPDADEVVGTWDGVDFTVDQAAAVLDLVNTASLLTLDIDAGLDRRAANGIVDTRPFTDIGALASVSYVGRAALTHLQDYAAHIALGQNGDDCDTDDDCAADLRCMGAVAYGSGIMCVDTWGVFSWEGPQTIPDDGTELATSVEVTGLASVPVDVILTLDLDHARPADLELSIDNFNGYGSTLWEGDADPQMEMVVRAFPSDDAVHGTYTVRVTDTVAGVEGQLLGWDLLIVSTYD